MEGTGSAGSNRRAQRPFGNLRVPRRALRSPNPAGSYGGQYSRLHVTVYHQRLSWLAQLGDAMLDVASFAVDLSPAAIIVSLLALPIVYVAAFNTGPVGKTAREVLAMFLRRPPK